MTQTADALSQTTTTVPKGSGRLHALDWMRGFVMVLMAVDHASQIFNAEKTSSDGWIFYDPDLTVSFAQFFTRWMTHLCAPTFLFLAGTALVLSLEKRRLRGVSDRTLDRHLLVRGLILIGIELTWWFPFIIQVLYAIGMSLICMIPLRRLSSKTLLLLAVAFIASGEAIYLLAANYSGLELEALKTRLAWNVGEGEPVAALGWYGITLPFITAGIIDKMGPLPILLLYPFVPWLVMMMLGWVFGRYLITLQQSPDMLQRAAKFLLVGGAVALGIFLVIRGVNGYGNLMLYRMDLSLSQWLNVSKYPPSLTYFALELGLMAVLMAGMFYIQSTWIKTPNSKNPILVFGQTAFFFYLLHFHFLGIGSGIMSAMGLSTELSLPGVYLAALAVLILLYPLCLWFRTYKASRPQSWVQYL